VSLLANSVKWVWAISVALQAALFIFLFFSGNFRRLRLLTTYTAVNLCQAAFILMLYSRVGASLEGVKLVAWYSEGVTLFFQALAAAEAIHLVLKPYPGIWALAWRSIALVSAIMVAYIAKHGARDYSWAILEAERGYHLIFAIAVTACFLLIRYYRIVVPSTYKLLLGGFCFYSCVMILICTLLQSIWWGSTADYESFWGFSSVFFFAAVQPLWIVAVRKPLPADDRRPALPSDDVYRQLTPQIDERLRAVNEKLMRIWELEARR
jgi:hypothetical protein